MARISTITDMYIRKYSDSGDVRAYVEWLDSAGQSGRTEGDARVETERPIGHVSYFGTGEHMTALIQRGLRQGIHIRGETL